MQSTMGCGDIRRYLQANIPEAVRLGFQQTPADERAALDPARRAQNRGNI